MPVASKARCQCLCFWKARQDVMSGMTFDQRSSVQKRQPGNIHVSQSVPREVRSVAQLTFNFLNSLVHLDHAFIKDGLGAVFWIEEH